MKRFIDFLDESKFDAFSGRNQDIKAGKEVTDTCVVCFGRMNPITKGHEAMVKDMYKESKKLDADCIVFVSRSDNKEIISDQMTKKSKNLEKNYLIKMGMKKGKLAEIPSDDDLLKKRKNPLTYKEKIKYVEKMCSSISPDIKVIATPILKNENGNIIKASMIEAVSKCVLMGKYKKIYIAGGADREGDINILQTYVKEQLGEDIEVNTINTQGEGTRFLVKNKYNMDEEVSGTFMRNQVIHYYMSDDEEEREIYKKVFISGCPFKGSLAEKLFDDVYKGMGFSEL